MASIAKNVTLSLGLISTTVRIESAVSAEETFKTVCLGQNTPHDATPIKRPNKCATCGELPFGAELHKAREVAGGLVLVTADELAAAKASHDDKFKGKIELVAHKADEVEGSTASGEKLYQLIPEGTDTSRYAVLCRLVAAHPDLAFVAMYTVRTRASMFVLRARNGVLLAEERVTRERLKPLPQLDDTVNEALFAMAASVVPQLVAPFDPNDYADGYLAAINEIVAQRDATPSAMATVIQMHTAGHSDEDIIAQLQAMVGEPAKAKSARKRKEPAA